MLRSCTGARQAVAAAGREWGDAAAAIAGQSEALQVLLLLLCCVY